METLNIQCIEQQQVLITLTLTDSNGAPVDLTKYAVYAASVGAVDPYCRRAARLEWAAAINNECSAFIVTAPGHDIARAPWKYTIYIKNRQLGLEWAVVTGRVELTPRACGTDGIAPASYSVACEATPSGLVNVTLDATVGSISETLEQVKASAAAAAAAAQNAHADLEDAETAATKASQAALASAADAKVASDKAVAAEAAATAAPEACAPYVQQTQQAAAAALEASRTATTAAAEAQASADAAAPAQGYATRAEQAKTAAVQAAADAATAATTATQQADAATAQAESARLAATTASTAADNAQQAATRAEEAATRAEAATPAADRAEAARDAAQASAATAVSAKSDLETARDTATAAATTATDAATAASTSETNATAAATAAATAQAAAEAAQAQADTDARACAIYDQRVAANATAATEAANTATEAANTATDAASRLISDELQSGIDLAIAAYLSISNESSTISNYITDNSQSTGIPRLSVYSSGDINKSDIMVIKAKSVNFNRYGNFLRVLYAPVTTMFRFYYNCYPMKTGKTCYIHAPNCTEFGHFVFDDSRKETKIIFSNETTFSHAVQTWSLFSIFNGEVVWAPGTKFENLKYGDDAFSYDSQGYQSFKHVGPPDTATFESLTNASKMFYWNKIERLPSAMVLTSALYCPLMFAACYQLEIDDIVRVCSTINDLQSLDTPRTGSLGLPSKCKHNGTEVANTQSYLNANHPDFLTTLAAKGWTVTFA